MSYLVSGNGLHLMFYVGFCDLSGNLDGFDPDRLARVESQDTWFLFGVRDLLSFHPGFDSLFGDWHTFLDLTRHKIGLKVILVFGSVFLIFKLLLDSRLDLFNFSIGISWKTRKSLHDFGHHLI